MNLSKPETLEQRLERSLKAFASSSRKLVKKLEKEERIATQRLRKAEELVKEREVALFHARRKHAEARGIAEREEIREKIKGRVEYNYKVRNR